MMSAYPEVDRALASGDARTAFDLLNAKAMAGEGAAFFELAVAFLEGRWLRRDLARSRHLFLDAARRGVPAAAAITSAFLAVGVGGPRDWAMAQQWLHAASAHDPLLAREIETLSRMALTTDGRPETIPSPEMISEDPRIQWVRQFLSADECALLIDKASPFLSPSVIIDPSTGSARPDPVRTSYNAIFPWVDETPFIHAINQRIAAACGSPVECGEPLQVLHYEEGQEYRRHSDALTGEANQRVMTALIYLNDGYDGGETEFPDLGIAMKGGVGDLLLFQNTLPDGRPHPLAVHIGRPVANGQKWLASRWVRQSPFGSPR